MPAQWQIHDVFNVLLLKPDSIKKRWINKFLLLKFEANDNKKYEIEVIRDSAIYAKGASKYLFGLYYLVEWKGYSEKKNI